MADAQDFDKRLARIVRHHERLSHGAAPVLTAGGLIIARPVRRSMTLPWRSFTIILLAIMAFKVYSYTSLGPEAYEARVAPYAEGSATERLGAWVMTLDPATIWLAEQVGLVVEFAKGGEAAIVD